MAGCMQDSRYHNDLLCLKDLIDNAIGKSLRVPPPYVLPRMSAGVQKRILGQRMPDPHNLFHEFCP
jgi:hypothetical protein